MVYRIKQFIWAIQSFYKSIDDEYIKRYLNKDEIKIFSLLKNSDKHHCIRVSKDVLNHLEKLDDVDIDKNTLIKLALLHDIGKIERPLNVVEKSIVVILDKLTKGRIKKYSNIQIIDIYYNHPKIGADILKKKCRYDKEFLKCIEEHHIKEVTSNKLIEIIKYYDNKN